MSELFKELYEGHGTGMWVNNPTVSEATEALARGALGCTTNPTFAARMVELGEISVDEVVSDVGADVDTKAAAVQRAAVARVAPIFADLFAGHQAHVGWVSLQGNPFAEDDAEAIIDEARRSRALAPNVIPKIPATDAGLHAIDVLVREGSPILATEVFALAQARAVLQTYETAVSAVTERPALFITHITGIFDECLGAIAAESGAAVSQRHLDLAGCALARHQHAMLRRAGFTGVMMGGGVRDMRHFTEMIGGPMVVTMNPKTADEILALDTAPPPRFDAEVDDEVIATLRRELDVFRRAWDDEGLAREAFADFPPVRHFRAAFERGWDRLRAALAPATAPGSGA